MANHFFLRSYLHSAEVIELNNGKNLKKTPCISSKRAMKQNPPSSPRSVAHRKNTLRAMISESYILYLSEQLSWRPLQEDSMQISCADNPASQRI